MNNQKIEQLKLILKSQDMGIPAIEKKIEQVKNYTFDPTTDPVTAVIINALCDTDMEDSINRIEYSISQLQKAIKVMKVIAENIPE